MVVLLSHTGRYFHLCTLLTVLPLFPASDLSVMRVPVYDVDRLPNLRSRNQAIIISNFRSPTTTSSGKSIISARSTNITGSNISNPKI